jgi:hypothetical protein
MSNTNLNKRAGRMPVTVSRNLLKKKEKEDDNNNNKYNERDNYGRNKYKSYNDKREDLDYTAYFWNIIIIGIAIIKTDT